MGAIRIDVNILVHTWGQVFIVQAWKADTVTQVWPNILSKESRSLEGLKRGSNVMNWKWHDLSFLAAH